MSLRVVGSINLGGKMRQLLFIVAATVMSTAVVYGSDTATQIVTMSTSAINELAISGSAPTLSISTAVAGAAPTSSASSSITYAITTNETSKKITGAINTNMPSGTTLSINLAAPSGASSLGNTSLSTTVADLVTGISTLNESGLSIDYTFAATAAAGVIASFTKTVTLTIVDGA
mgnify:CR=1 FL=1